MPRNSRPISWIKAARKEFEAFPPGAQIGTEIWVIRAFRKKSKSGIKTPKQEIDLIHERLKRP